MPIITQTVCEHPSCGKKMGESNHWWKVFVFLKGGAEGSYPKYFTTPNRSVTKQPEGSEIMYFCSDTCLIKAESRIRQGLDPRC